MAEDAARELPNLPLEDALQLVHLYAERGSPKYEKAALRWLERYITEGSPRLQHFAETTASLCEARAVGSLTDDLWATAGARWRSRTSGRRPSFASTAVPRRRTSSLVRSTDLLPST
jgi:hypothetical protein